MHNATLANSNRLLRVARLLVSRRPLSTRQIARCADVCAVNSIIAELRANGWDIACRQRNGKKGRIFEYVAMRIPARHMEMLA